ncbi:hypothetical protein M0802_011208 [Mischocyttarus mexicanus]|nr:hypothetical protein M0802_011208 [Mischocyttarus mexicanus]
MVNDDLWGFFWRPRVIFHRSDNFLFYTFCRQEEEEEGEEGEDGKEVFETASLVDLNEETPKNVFCKGGKKIKKKRRRKRKIKSGGIGDGDNGDGSGDRVGGKRRGGG